MGQQWSAVALNEAKKTQEPLVILLTSLQRFSFFHSQATWSSTWCTCDMHWAKWATWPQVRSKNLKEGLILFFFFLPFIFLLKFLMWTFHIKWNHAFKYLHPDAAYQSFPLLHLFIFSRITPLHTHTHAPSPGNLTAIKPASSPAGQGKGGWKPASSNSLCLVIYSILAQTEAKPPYISCRIHYVHLIWLLMCSYRLNVA